MSVPYCYDIGFSIPRSSNIYKKIGYIHIKLLHLIWQLALVLRVLTLRYCIFIFLLIMFRSFELYTYITNSWKWLYLNSIIRIENLLERLFHVSIFYFVCSIWYTTVKWNVFEGCSCPESPLPSSVCSDWCNFFEGEKRTNGLKLM